VPGPCQVCSDGTQACTTNACVGGQCLLESPGCGPSSCAPMSAASEGGCVVPVGYAWDGASCQAITCGCAGSDCGRLYPDAASCQSAHALCGVSGGSGGGTP
jgi:hypothetical protein